jgi:hypothetical protein
MLTIARYGKNVVCTENDARARETNVKPTSFNTRAIEALMNTCRSPTLHHRLDAYATDKVSFGIENREVGLGFTHRGFMLTAGSLFRESPGVSSPFASILALALPSSSTKAFALALISRLFVSHLLRFSISVPPPLYSRRARSRLSRRPCGTSWSVRHFFVERLWRWYVSRQFSVRHVTIDFSDAISRRRWYTSSAVASRW